MRDLDTLKELLKKVDGKTISLRIEPRLHGQPLARLQQWQALSADEIKRRGGAEVDYYFITDTPLDNAESKLFTTRGSYEIDLPDGGKRYYWCLQSSQVDRLVKENLLGNTAFTAFDVQASGAMFPIISSDRLARYGIGVVPLGSHYALVMRTHNGPEAELQQVIENTELSTSHQPNAKYQLTEHGRVAVVPNLPKPLAEAIARTYGLSIPKKRYATAGAVFDACEANPDLFAPGQKPQPRDHASSKRTKTPAPVAVPAPTDAQLIAACRAYGAQIVDVQQGDGSITHQLRLQQTLSAQKRKELDLHPVLTTGDALAKSLQMHFTAMFGAGTSMQPGLVTLPFAAMSAAKLREWDGITQQTHVFVPFTLPAVQRAEVTHKYKVGRTKPKPVYLYPYIGEDEQPHLLLVLNRADLPETDRKWLDSNPRTYFDSRLQSLKLKPLSSSDVKPLPVSEGEMPGLTASRYCMDVTLHPDIYDRLIKGGIAASTAQAASAIIGKGGLIIAEPAEGGPSPTLTNAQLRRSREEQRAMFLQSQPSERSYIMLKERDGKTHAQAYFLLSTREPNTALPFTTKARELGLNINPLHYWNSTQQLISVSLGEAVTKLLQENNNSSLLRAPASAAEIYSILKSGLKQSSLEEEQANLVSEPKANHRQFAFVSGDDGEESPHAFFILKADQIKRFEKRAKGLGLSLDHRGKVEADRKHRYEIVSVALPSPASTLLRAQVPAGELPQAAQPIDTIIESLTSRAKTIIQQQKAAEKLLAEQPFALTPALVRMVKEAPNAMRATITLPDLTTIDHMIEQFKQSPEHLRDMLDGHHQQAQAAAKQIKSLIGAVSSHVPSVDALKGLHGEIEASARHAKSGVYKQADSMTQLLKLRRWVDLYGTQLPVLILRGKKGLFAGKDWENIVGGIGKNSLAADTAAIIDRHLLSNYSGNQKSRTEALVLTPSIATQMDSMLAEDPEMTPLASLAEGAPVNYADLANIAGRHFTPDSDTLALPTPELALNRLGKRAMIAYERQNQTANGKRVTTDDRGGQPVLYLTIHPRDVRDGMDLLAILQQHGGLAGSKNYDASEHRSEFGSELAALHEWSSQWDHFRKKILPKIGGDFGAASLQSLPLDCFKAPLLLSYLENPLAYLTDKDEALEPFALVHLLPFIAQAMEGHEQEIKAVLNAITEGKPVDCKSSGYQYAASALEEFATINDRLVFAARGKDYALEALKDTNPDLAQELEGVRMRDLHLYPIAREEAVAHYSSPEVTLYHGNEQKVIPLDEMKSLKKQIAEQAKSANKADIPLIIRCPLTDTIMDELTLQNHRIATAGAFLNHAQEQLRDGLTQQPMLAEEAEAEEESNVRRLPGHRKAAADLSRLARDNASHDTDYILGLLRQHYEIAVDKKAASRSVA
jgi:hypothetical protein